MLSTMITARKISDKIVRAETAGRIAARDLATAEQMLSTGTDRFGNAINAEFVADQVATLRKAVARHEKAVKKGEADLAALGL
jgi:hypothetical protein